MDSPKLQMPVGDPYSICNGTSPDSLRALPSNSIDQIITDPPYGLTDKSIDIRMVMEAFLNKQDFKPKGGGFNKNEWDAFVPGPQVWIEAYRILKPGGYLVAFCAKRTIHYLAMAVQMAGFEIKDQILWFHGQGTPKTEKISRTLEEAGANNEVLSLFGNYRGDLRPLYEPILIAHKPINSLNTAHNLIRNGVGGINAADILATGYAGDIVCDSVAQVQRHFNGKGSGIKIISSVLSFSRASEKEKKAGVENLIIPGASKQKIKSGSFANQNPVNGFNFHPTVKPVELMSYLIELFSIEGSIVLDPFCGSGSTGVASLITNRQFMGVEKDPNFFAIAKHRIEEAAKRVGQSPTLKAEKIKTLFQDNSNIKSMRELSLKIQNNTATLDEFRHFNDLLSKFGPTHQAA